MTTTVSTNGTAGRARAEYLVQNIRHAYALGYNIEPCWVWWNPTKRGGQGGKDVRGLRKDWQHLGRLTLGELEHRVSTGTANGYLVHGSTSVPHLGGATLLDGDTTEECVRISAAVGGAAPHVRSGSGWWHWYARGVLKSSVALKTKDTAFGPGTWYLGPDGAPRQYQGALPDAGRLLVVHAMPAVVSGHGPAPLAATSPAGFWQTIKSADTAARQWVRLRDQVIGFVRRCEMFGWGSDAHGQLLELTRELAQLAPEHATRALGEWFAAGGAGYVDNRVWAMLDTALGKYTPDTIVAPERVTAVSQAAGGSGATMSSMPVRTVSTTKGGGSTPDHYATAARMPVARTDRPTDADGSTAPETSRVVSNANNLEPKPRRLPMIPDEVWEAYGWSRSIRAQARAADVCPDAVLGAMLASYASRVDPSVRIVTGTKMPLGCNLVVSLVGPSGSDKSTAFGLAQRMMPGSSVPVVNNPGSGEAFAASLTEPDPDFEGPARQRPKVLKQDPRALFYVSEGALLGSVAGRLGSTWLPHLRALAVDESLSTTNATSEINRQVPAQRYRAAVVVGFQVTTAGLVLHDTGTGTAQRFLWFTSLSSEDTSVDGQAEVPYVAMAIPAITRLGQGSDETGEIIRYLTVAQSITARIVAEQRAERLSRDIAATDDYDAHRHTLIAKLAALAVLADGRVMIEEHDWRWAEALYAASAATRTELLDIAESAAHSEQVSRGQGMARTDRARRSFDGDEARVAAVVLRRIDRDGTGFASRRDIARSIESRDRGLLAGALEQLVTHGYIKRSENGRGYTRLT